MVQMQAKTGNLPRFEVYKTKIVQEIVIINKRRAQLKSI